MDLHVTHSYPVSNVFVRAYVWLRAVCAAWLYAHMRPVAESLAIAIISNMS